MVSVELGHRFHYVIIINIIIDVASSRCHQNDSWCLCEKTHKNRKEKRNSQERIYVRIKFSGIRMGERERRRRRYGETVLNISYKTYWIIWNFEFFFFSGQVYSSAVKRIFVLLIEARRRWRCESWAKKRWQRVLWFSYWNDFEMLWVLNSLISRCWLCVNRFQPRQRQHLQRLRRRRRRDDFTRARDLWFLIGHKQ